ncbi:hypothetical protein AFLA70_171g002391 [Aspergillus flavus AF70]|nr:hypothetical protein AFLA70_171g002391 [Aspergillus flavus AF70]
MSSDLYKSVPLEPNATRMVRLLPDKETNAEIKCELFTYDLTGAEGGKHLYEALSYVWSGDEEGSAEKHKEIILHGHTVPITANLHAALVNLRDHQLERVLWVDAICINQDDMDEKNQQIPLMRTIYAQADRVIIWLGEAFKDGDKALEIIRTLAEKKFMSGNDSATKLLESSSEPCLKLLRRKWFRRIWVLQEAGVARSIEIMCGSVQINGYTFCEGLGQLEIPSSLGHIHPVVYLIRGAHFRPRNAPKLRGSLCIGELIEMYRYHMASTSHDKVYALLGLAADDPNTPGLKPDYNVPWYDVFSNTIQYILSGEGIVETYPEKDIAIIQTKCWILGCIGSVEDIYESNRQKLNILFNDTPESSVFQNEWGRRWMIQASAEPIQSCDILCLLRGNSNPCIIRLSKDHFTIINIAITPQQPGYNDKPDTESLREMDSRQSPPYDITLTWARTVSDTENDVRPRDPMELIQIAPQYQKEGSDTEKGSTDLRLIADGISVLLANQGEPGLFKDWLTQMGTAVPVSEQVVKAVVGNTTPDGPQIVEMLLQYQGNLPVTEEVVKVAAEHNGGYAPMILDLLLEYRDNIPVTEEVVKAVAMNKEKYTGY